MKRAFLSLALAFLSLSLFVCPVFAVSPSNSGFTGLWEYPTAEMAGDGKGWVGWSEFAPYRSYYVTLGYLPWLEYNLRLTRFATGPLISEGYGRYKDKAVDLKCLLFSQADWLPNIAVGTMDMTGTEIRKAYYAVGTYTFDRWAFSLGYATDSYEGVFGGVSWQALDWLEFKAEYSPLDYTKDYVSGKYLHPDPAESDFNYGAVLKSPWGINATVSYQRGEELCYGFYYSFDLSKPIFGKKRDKPIVEDPDRDVPSWNEVDLQAMAERLQELLGAKGSGLRDVAVFVGDKRVLVAYENIGFSSQAEALARVMVISSWNLPWDIETFSVVPRVRGRATSRVDVSGSQLGLLRMGKLNRYDGNAADFYWVSRSLWGTKENETWNIMVGPGKSRRNGSAEVKVALAYEPRLDRTLDEDYMDRWSLDYIGRLRSSSGWEVYLQIRQPLENSIDIWWEPSANDETRIWKGVLSYLHPMGDGIFGLAEVGWLDESWFGANVWARWYMGDFWAGGRFSMFKERDPYSFASMADYKVNLYGGIDPANGENDWANAMWLEGGYHDGVYDLDLKGMYGKFIDDDKGYRIDVTRHWDDRSVGFYYTNTDVKAPDRGYTNIGMVLDLPADMWFGDWMGEDTSTVWHQEFTLLSSWSFYSGRIPGAWKTPEQLLGQLRPELLRRNLYLALDDYGRSLRGRPSYHDEVLRSHSLYDYITGEYRVKEDGALLGVQ